MVLHVPPAPPPTVPPAALQAPRTASCGLNSTRRIRGFWYGFFVFVCFCLSNSFMHSPHRVSEIHLLNFFSNQLFKLTTGTAPARACLVH
jgi:hypothetical protein